MHRNQFIIISLTIIRYYSVISFYIIYYGTAKKTCFKYDKKKRTSQICEKSLFFMKQITFLCHIQPHNFHLERYINIPLTNRINFFYYFYLAGCIRLDSFLFSGICSGVYRCVTVKMKNCQGVYHCHFFCIFPSLAKLFPYF